MGHIGRTLGPWRRAFAVSLIFVAACRGPAVSETLASSASKSPYFAAIDMGSSGAKMLVQQRSTDGSMVTVKDVRLSTRLGEGVASGDSIPVANQDRTLAAIKSLVTTAHDEFGIAPGSVALIATAVTRNATNGREFLTKIQHDLGLARARILTGEEEAHYGYLGAIAKFRSGGHADDRYATLDLGGGSFQLAVGTRDAFASGGSTQIGSNQIVSKWLPEGSLTAAQFQACDLALEAEAPMPLAPELLHGARLVGTGSISKFLAAHLGHPLIAASEIQALRSSLGALAPKSRVPLLRGTKSPEVLTALGLASDADALDYAIKAPASATLLLHIMKDLAVTEMTVSETDVRHVLIAELALAKK